jgi:SAM-dependent methyltransferase
LAGRRGRLEIGDKGPFHTQETNPAFVLGTPSQSGAEGKRISSVPVCSPLQGFLRNHRFTKRLVYRVIRPRAKGVVKAILPYLPREQLILDIGSGSCNVAELLTQQGLSVIPLDIRNVSFVDSKSPMIYDGYSMPFRDKEFSTSLLLFVLHHASDPIKLLVETKRVCRKLLLFEDIITSLSHKYLTVFVDMILNLEFGDQPHFNKRDDEWQEVFGQLGLQLVDLKYRAFGLALKQALYVLKT